MSKSYKIRIADQLLARKLAGVGAVLVEGPKWCGKTTTCEQLAKSVLYMGDPETRSRYGAVDEDGFHAGNYIKIEDC